MLETIYYRNKAKEECFCCSSSVSSRLEVKEFADTEPELPGLMLCHLHEHYIGMKPEASRLLSNEITSYSLMAFFLLLLFCFLFFYEQARSIQKCSVHFTVLWFWHYCCVSVHICEVLECIIFVMQTILTFLFFLNDGI